MAIFQKIMGQEIPAAATPTLLYTVPLSTNAVAATIFACNRGGSGVAKIRIALVPNGETLDDEHWIYYDFSVPENQTFATTTGIGLAPEDEIHVETDTEIVTFTVTGPEFIG